MDIGILFFIFQMRRKGKLKSLLRVMNWWRKCIRRCNCALPGAYEHWRVPVGLRPSACCASYPPLKSKTVSLFAAVFFYERTDVFCPVLIKTIIIRIIAAYFVQIIFGSLRYFFLGCCSISSSMKEAINCVGDKFGLPNGWLNDDFKKTASYTPKIAQFAKHYRTYSNIVTFMTVTGEYLVAMKMKSGRKYKYDRSDIIGVLWEQEKFGDPLTIDRIRKAVENLYGSYDVLPEEIRQFVEQAVRNGNYEEMYMRVRQAEAENKENLLEYQAEKPDIITGDNVNDIIEALRKRKDKQQ